MSVYKRGGVYWYEFIFNGARIRETAKTASKTVAKEAERARRRDLERAVNGLVKRSRPSLFPVAVRQWLDSRGGLAPITLGHYRIYARRLCEYFGERLVCDIGEAEIAAQMRVRERQGCKPRRINFELAVLRMLLRHFGIWDSIKGRVRPLRERHDVGRAISREDEERLLGAIRKSNTPALLPLFVLSIDTGLRASEVRAIRYSDLSLTWRDGAIESGWVIVRRSKTEGGTDRTIPLTRRTCAALSIWISRFPGATRDSYLFPAHRIGFSGNDRGGHLYAIDLNRPLGSWKKAWRDARRLAGVNYRWHDCRHTLISRLAENSAVSEQTIMTLAGHVSKSMLARYSHIRSQAKQAAIAALERADFATDPTQNSPQSSGAMLEIDEKSLN